MRFIIKFILNIIGILAVSHLLTPNIEIKDAGSAAIVVIVLAVLNMIVRPILVLLTIPVTLLTLGLFLLVINAIIVLLADYLIDGFYVNGFLWALIFSLILSAIHYVIDMIVSKKE
ncbi:MAG: phage holin family protein [Cytophagaceae bacterium]|jgi:putative membrane protein